MADRAITHSDFHATVTTTPAVAPAAIGAVRASGPAAAGQAGTLSDAPAVRASHWSVVLGITAVLFGAAELFFRANVLWQLPPEYLLQDENDRYTRATWLVHNPPASGGNEILLLGSSPAAAISDLPDGGSQQILREALDQPALQLISMAVYGACYAEHLTLLENALAQGHHPKAVILFSWPSCIGPYRDYDALMATRMPLVSESLANLQGSDRSVDVRIQATFARVSAVHRYRYTVNAWLRNQWRLLLRGQGLFEPVAFEGRSRTTAWKGDLRLDRERYERLTTLPQRLADTGHGSRQLGALLDLARQKRVPVLIVESPWSPPFFDVLGGEADAYYRTMQTIAARGDSIYVDPNRSTRLSAEMFNDLFHVNYAGARTYLPLVASELRRFARAW